MAVTLKPPVPRAFISEAGQDEAGNKGQVITYPWSVYLRDLRDDVDNTPIKAASFFVETQNASIGTTTIVTPDQTGFYGFQFYAAITTAAATSSSLTVTLGWTDGGTTKTKAFTAITGNTTTTTGSETYLISADGAAPITYATTYASNGAGEMVYKLFGIVNSVASE